MTDMTRGALAVAIVVLTCAPAWAQKLVAVAKVEGDRDGSVTAAVVAALDGEFKVISPKAVARSADDMSVDINDQQAGRLIADLEADALVMGTVEKTSDGHKLQLRVFPLGARKSRSAWIIYAGRPKTEKVQTGVRTAVSTILGAAESAAAEPEAAPQDEPRGKGKGKKGKGKDKDKDKDRDVEEVAAATDEEDPLRSKDKVFRPVTGQPGKSRFAERTGAEDAPDPDEEVKAEAPRDPEKEDEEAADVGLGAEELAAKRAIAPPARVNVGPSVSTRSLRFSHRAFNEAPKDYRGDGVVPGVRAQGEVYPLAFGGGGALAGLGVGFELDQTFGLKIRTAGMELPTTVRHYSVDLRFRLGNKRTKPSVTLVAGYGRRTFVVSRGTVNVDLPDVDYQMINPGLAFRLPMGKVAFFGDARALLVTSAGAIEKQTSYGAATISAFEAEAGLEIELSRRLALRLAGDIAILGYDFKGNGAMSNNRDMDATTTDVGGAADRFLGGALTLAVSY